MGVLPRRPREVRRALRPRARAAAGKEMDYGERAAHTALRPRVRVARGRDGARAGAQARLAADVVAPRRGATSPRSSRAAALARPWKFLQKKWAKEARATRRPPPRRHERDFIPDLLQGFVAALAEAADDDEAARTTARARRASRTSSAPSSSSSTSWRSCRRGASSTQSWPTPTSSCPSASPALSPFAARGGKRAALFNLLHKLLEYYERFEVDDHRGTPVSEADAKASRSDALQALQRAAFAQDGLREFALSNLSAVDSPAQLRLHFGRLAPAQLGALCEGLGLLHSAADGEAKGKPFLVGMLVHRYQRRDVAQESLARLRCTRTRSDAVGRGATAPRGLCRRRLPRAPQAQPAGDGPHATIAAPPATATVTTASAAATTTSTASTRHRSSSAALLPRAVPHDQRLPDAQLHALPPRGDARGQGGHRRRRPPDAAAPQREPTARRPSRGGRGWRCRSPTSASSVWASRSSASSAERRPR